MPLSHWVRQAAILLAPAVLTISVIAQGPAPPSFSAGDQLAAARTLCGNVSRGTVKDDIAGTPEVVTGFLAADKRSICIELLSASYAERGVSRRVVVFGEHYVDEEGILDSSQGARATLHVVLLESRGGKWTVALKETELAETGFNGRDPVVALRKIGAERHALEVEQTLWNAGSSAANLALYELGADGFAEILSVNTSADDCGQHDPCFTYEGSVAYPVTSDPNAFDIRLTLKGTYRNGAGRILKMPAAPLVFRFAKGEYAPVLTTTAMREVWKAMQSPW
jgi:hypothetical protein